ncbi:MAG: M20 family metallopeptidase [Gemmatimonadota bacterium]|nr:M20 family metallopeptidase [Gemmatimonadota bacterium]
MDAGHILEQCRSSSSRVIEWRRMLHRIPETGLECPKTEAAIQSVLDQLGVRIQEDYSGPGVVALVEGELPHSGAVALRADIDALPIEEAEGREYGSGHPGRMHACGHDAHAAIALGAADFLSRNRKHLPGMVKFIFQPAEETVNGAQRMVEAGALENPRADCLLGLHVGNIWPEVGLGQVGVCYKPMMAAADMFEFRMRSGGGHGAAPHTSGDPVLAAARAITGLHSIISRNIDPLDPAVITVGRISGGTACNIIPTEVSAEGTVRTLDDSTRDTLETRIGDVVAHSAASFGCTHEFTYLRASSRVENDHGMVDLVRKAAVDLLSPDGVHVIERPSLTGEDVSVFLDKVPGCFFALGTSNPSKGRVSLHHSPVFDIEESVLFHGVAVFCLSALRFLEQQGAGLAKQQI